MIDIEQKKYFKVAFLALLVFLIILSIIMIWPYIVVLLTSIVVAYIFYPVYKLLYKKIKMRNLSALIVSIIVILIIAIPMYFAVSSMTREVNEMYVKAKDMLIKEGVFSFECNGNNVLCERLTDFTSKPEIKYYIDYGINKVRDILIEKASTFIFSIPRKMLDLFIMFFVLFFLFRDGEKIANDLKSLIPLKESHQKHVFKQVNNVTKAVLFGYVVTAIIQGVIAAVGYWLFGIPSPLLWGLLTIFAALVPFIGTALVWLPLSIIEIAVGYFQGSSSIIWKGVGLFIYGALLVSTVDNLIRPGIIGSKAKVHPVVILLGVVGGLSIFGIAGIVIGPLVLALLISFLELYREEMRFF